ncbi:hypothetical protein ACFV0O_20415 [Kitasatospora sp. NPDC059577]|uniref:hypothetical protein n=1 Tax=Kitasatospora sp. NPDC059577 TaxID=3346873 RepID=UPI00368F9E7F
MCRRVACRRCGKPTYAGCGMHVEQVLAGVPASARCACTAQERTGGGWLARLFGRR